MKKLIILLLCTLLATGCSIQSVDPKVEETQQPLVVEKVIEFEPRDVTASYIVIDSERLNVRVDADVESEKIGQVAQNESYQVIEEKYDSQMRIWYKIMTSEGTKGYVAGWFCAKTNITLHVEADSATIKGIETEAIPRYVENPFDEDSARVGDQIVGQKIIEISQADKEKKIVFSGEVKLTGSFYHENSDLSFGRVVRFVPDEGSSVLLPRIKDEVISTQFILENYDKVAGQFGEIGNTGSATITISNYTINYGDKEYNEAELVEVELN